MNFYQAATQEMHTSAVLALRGLPVSKCDVMIKAGFYPVAYHYPEYDIMGESLAVLPLVQEGDGYVQGFSVVKLAQEEIDANLARQAERWATVIRDERDKRLSESDRTQLADMQGGMAEGERGAWVVYRQELRNLPAQEGFPWGGVVDDVSWPEGPK